MRKKNKKPSLSTEPKPGTTIVPPNSFIPADQGSTSRVLHNSTNTLTLDRFILCLCYDRLDALIVSGKFTERELQDAWYNGVYIQFIDLSYSTDKKALQTLTRNMIATEARIMRVKRMVQYMAVQFDEEYADELRKLNFRYKFDWNRRKEYTADLKMILSRIKGLEIDLAMMQDEYESYIKKDEGDKPDEIYFIQTLTRLAKWQGGGRLDPKEVTVTEYLMIKNDYHEHIDELNRKKNAKR